jgi:hypothetical protein
LLRRKLEPREVFCDVFIAQLYDPNVIRRGQSCLCKPSVADIKLAVYQWVAVMSFAPAAKSIAVWDGFYMQGDSATCPELGHGIMYWRIPRPY